MSAASDTQPNDVSLIDNQEEMERLFLRFSSEQIIAVDTEAASFHRFRDRVYLLQLSSRQETAIIDPLAVTDLGSFGKLLRAPEVEVVFHDADYDLRLLRQEYGFSGQHLFDTRIAAQLLNEPGIGLAALLEKYFGIHLDKRYQRADWSQRPLTRPMLEYAAADTRFLLPLRDLLREQLRERGRLSWAEEEFALLSMTQREPADPEEPGYLRIKGAKALNRRGLAILRELAQWREDLARRTDKAAFRILSNEPMLEMAKAPPRDLAALKQVKGVGHEMFERRGKEIFTAIERGMVLPESELPRLPRPNRRPPDPAYDARLERLKGTRVQLAERYQLPPGVLCPNGTLEVIARCKPTTLEQLAEIRELRRWQLEEFGAELLTALRESERGGL